jgi:hypothetical protein
MVTFLFDDNQYYWINLYINWNKKKFTILSSVYLKEFDNFLKNQTEKRRSKNQNKRREHEKQSRNIYNSMKF